MAEGSTLQTVVASSSFEVGLMQFYAMLESAQSAIKKLAEIWNAFSWPSPRTAAWDEELISTMPQKWLGFAVTLLYAACDYAVIWAEIGKIDNNVVLLWVRSVSLKSNGPVEEWWCDGEFWFWSVYTWTYRRQKSTVLITCNLHYCTLGWLDSFRADVNE